MSWRLHALVAGATLPLMLRYGYLRVIRRGS
jgi:hypothetical protein